MEILKSDNELPWSPMYKLTWVIVLAVVFVSIEIAAGIYSQSVGVLADAAHLASLSVGVIVSIASLSMAKL